MFETEAERNEWNKLLDSFGPSKLDDLVENAMTRATVKKSRRPHVAKVCRYFIEELRSAHWIDEPVKHKEK